jgi:hypothetical protein
LGKEEEVKKKETTLGFDKAMENLSAASPSLSSLCMVEQGHPRRQISLPMDPRS